jgi:hypothetical protein
MAAEVQTVSQQNAVPRGAGYPPRQSSINIEISSEDNQQYHNISNNHHHPQHSKMNPESFKGG